MRTVINIKTDKATKVAAKRLAEKMGLPLGTLINSYLEQFVRSREVHFSLAPQMTPYLEAIIEEAERDLKEGKNISPILSSPEEVKHYLNSL